jgi:hypothetical protein
MAEEVKINITAETAGVEGQLKGTAAGVTAVGATSKAAAPAVRGLAGTIDVLRGSLSALQKAFGLLAIISLAISWLIKLYEAVKSVIAWFKKLDDPAANSALDKTAESAKAAADSVKKLADSYDALAAARKKLRDDAAAEANSFLAGRISGGRTRHSCSAARPKRPWQTPTPPRPTPAPPSPTTDPSVLPS